jgi:AcrR family transcriptional regulator
MNGNSSSSSSTPPTRASRLRERLREATAEAILAAAEQVFGEEGLAAAHMEGIAARAGVAVGTLYNHFEDRGALVAELVRRRRRDLVERIDRAVASAAGEPFPQRLRRFAEALFEHVDLHGPLLAALVEAGEGPARSSHGVAGALQERAAALMAAGVQERRLRPDEGDLHAVAFVGMIRAVFMRDVQRRSRPARAPQVEALVDLFLRGAGR